MFEHLAILDEAGYESSEDMYGVYVLRSRMEKGLYRVGACGINGRGTISGRFGTHSGRNRPDDRLWTNRNKPWDPIWCVSIVKGDRSLVSVAEQILYLAMARRYEIVDVSGFRAPPDSTKEIQALANEAAREIDDFIKMALERRVGA